MAFTLPPRKGTQFAKKITGIVFIFIGSFFCLIGFLFSFLFEVYGLLALAGVGIVFIIIAITLMAASKDVSLFEMANYRKTIISQYGYQAPLQKQCEACSRIIPPDAILCPYCGHREEHQIEKSTIKQNFPLNCPSCGSKTEPGVKFCYYCGSELK